MGCGLVCPFNDGGRSDYLYFCATLLWKSDGNYRGLAFRGGKCSCLLFSFYLEPELATALYSSLYRGAPMGSGRAAQRLVCSGCPLARTELSVSRVKRA